MLYFDSVIIQGKIYQFMKIKHDISLLSYHYLRPLKSTFLVFNIWPVQIYQNYLTLKTHKNEKLLFLSKNLKNIIIAQFKKNLQCKQMVIDWLQLSYDTNWYKCLVIPDLLHILLLLIIPTYSCAGVEKYDSLWSCLRKTPI